MKHKIYTIFDALETFKAEQEDEVKRQRYVFVDPEDMAETVNTLLNKLNQPMNLVTNTTTPDAEDKEKEHPVIKIGFMSTGERYGEIKAKLEYAGLINKGTVKEVEMKKETKKTTKK